ncbi:MAG TPA: metallophosphoesterase [Bacteroidia bacterium]|nr:metallophosphoesterase [Bacteroidia bacterium]
MFIRFLIFFILIVLVELYFLQALKTISIDYTPQKRKIIFTIAYIFAGINILISSVAMFYPPPEWNNLFRFISSMFLIIFVCKLIGSSFLLIDDIVRLFRWIAGLFNKAPKEAIEDGAEKISRLKFFSYLAVTFTVIPAVSFLYGMVRGAYRYRVHKVKVSSPNLPEAFDGFKIVQLSDMHCGSFMSTEPLQKAFNIVMEQKPDAIFFTGDLVNNEATETEMHLDTYKMLKAPYGVYSILGNHDYGDYKQWETPEDKIANLDKLKHIQHQSGWRLLMNEHVPIEKDGQKIALLGIENWGGNLRFPRYGKLENAHAGTEAYPYKILLSHDPSHWDVQVSQEAKYNDIDLTLSGHTHGMQFGIEIPGFIKWSPVKYIYKHWAGLYKQDNQYLYVNRGLGFLGYPGRLGIWPEITVIELSRA